MATNAQRASATISAEEAFPRVSSSGSLLERVVSDRRLTFLHDAILHTQTSVEFVDETRTIFAPLDSSFGGSLREARAKLHDPEYVEFVFDLLDGFLADGRHSLVKDEPTRILTLSGATLDWDGLSLTDGRGTSVVRERIDCKNGVLYLLERLLSAGYLGDLP